jgi:hypothetical protein
VLHVMPRTIMAAATVSARHRTNSAAKPDALQPRLVRITLLSALDSIDFLRRSLENFLPWVQEVPGAIASLGERERMSRRTAYAILQHRREAASELEGCVFAQEW